MMMRLPAMALLGVLLVTSNTASAQQGFQPDPGGSVLSSPGGRYVLGQISNARRDQYLLDTKTGKLWVIVVDEDKRTLLQPVYYVYFDGSFSYEPSEKIENRFKIKPKISSKKPDATTSWYLLGNKKTKQYYSRYCAGYDKVPRKARAFFKSANDAKEAGYRPALSCFEK